MSSFKMSLWCQTLLVLFTVVYSTADEDYENKLTKLWSLSGTSNVDGSAVLNVTSASIVIQPSSYNDEAARTTRYSRQPQKYAFKPRAIPLRRADQPSQVERTVYYTPDEYKSEVLFPGNYLPIAKEKSNENLTKDSVYTPRSGGFHPKAIPLIRSEEYQKRSLDEDSEPIIKKPEGFSEQTASRRSISYLFGDLDDSEDGEDDGEDDIDTEDGSQGKHRKKPKIKAGKLKKYVLPLLLAYKMKYFTLIPVLIGGLILLIGATGLAGFFFALFAAVMGLQKGGY